MVKSSNGGVEPSRVEVSCVEMGAPSDGGVE